MRQPKYSSMAPQAFSFSAIIWARVWLSAVSDTDRLIGVGGGRLVSASSSLLVFSSSMIFGGMKAVLRLRLSSGFSRGLDTTATGAGLDRASWFFRASFLLNMRSCQKLRNGAMPVPGPTMMIGILGSSGR